MTGMLDFGPAGARRFSRTAGRSISDGMGAIRYPSPFFDIAHTYLPASFKVMLKWCRYYFLSNPLINAVCYKMAEYPVTDLIFDTDNNELRRKWELLFKEVLKFKKFEVEVGLDYNCYGNCFISIFYPFIKYLICKRCKSMKRVDQVKYTFSNFQFNGECRRCGNYGPFNVRDFYVRSVRDIRLIRWNPEQITIQHNDATGESLYYYTVPGTLSNDLRMGKKHVIEKTPQVFIDALRKNKSLLFNSDNLFHLRRPTIAQKDKGWGLPMILPVLKDTFYLQVLRKAQEAIAVEHIVPLRILFPQSATGTSDPYSTVNLSTWKVKIEQELLRWRIDNNYIPILPLPIGQQTLGGEGRALMLAQEYRVWQEAIVAGMGVPTEFIFGGMQYSGSNVSMRILENHFLDYKADHDALVQDFIMPRIGAFMGWQPVPTHFKRFKMADDLQRSAFNLQLNQAGKLSDRSMLEETDWNAEVESDRIAMEQRRTLASQRIQAVGQAQIQGETQLVLQKYQLRAQKLMEQSMSTGAVSQPGAGGPMEQPSEPNPAAGGPGVSPMAAGQQMIGDQAQVLAAGQTGAPPILPPEQAKAIAQQQAAGGGQEGELPPGLQSPISTEDKMDGPVDAIPVGVGAITYRIAAWLDGLSDAEKQPHLAELRKNNPQLYSHVLTMLRERQGSHMNSAAMPAPNARAPRRGPESAPG
jgi:hypothetical protein